jgi:hypothetical protein
MGDIIDGKSRGISRLTDIDGATIVLPVIEAVRACFKLYDKY